MNGRDVRNSQEGLENMLFFVILFDARKIMIVVGIPVLKVRLSITFTCSIGRWNSRSTWSDEQREPRNDEEPENGDA